MRAKVAALVLLVASVVTAQAPRSQFYTASAYCLRGRTASGRMAGPGQIASDWKVLPRGTRVFIDAGKYSGFYTVTDRGGRINGRRIDIWMQKCSDAWKFGVKRVRVDVLPKEK